MPEPRIKKTYLVSIEAAVIVSVGYEVEAYTLDDALSNTEELLKSEFDLILETCHDSGYYFQDIDIDASEVEG